MQDESKNNGGPAFPTCEDGRTMAYCTGGMTLRDWFAGMWLQVASSRQVETLRWKDATSLASQAYLAADAMLSTR